jgi:hypothetical protein
VVLGSYRTHAAAQHAVDILAEHRFPVEHITIVGTDLRLQEVVLGRWTWGRTLLAGAAAGGWIGLLVGLIFLIFTPWEVASMITSICAGVVLGVVWAAIAHVWQQRSFAAVPTVVANRYDVLVDARFADEARRVLTEAVATPVE